jgi:hypothetical protein
MYVEHNDLNEPGMHTHVDRDSSFPPKWLASDTVALEVAGWVPDTGRSAGVSRHGVRDGGSPIGERFRVGAEVNHVHGGGTLTVAPGSIVLEMDRPTRAFSGVARIAHTDRDVVVVTARLIPPWFNTSLALQGDGTSGVAVTWVLARRRLCDSLTAAGFNVREAKTRFSRYANGQAPPAFSDRRSWASGRVRSVVALASLVTGAILILLVSKSPVFVAVIAGGVVLNFAALFRR